MLPDQVSNPGPLTYESGALPIALRGPAIIVTLIFMILILSKFFPYFSAYLLLNNVYVFIATNICQLY